MKGNTSNHNNIYAHLVRLLVGINSEARIPHVRLTLRRFSPALLKSCIFSREIKCFEEGGGQKGILENISQTEKVLKRSVLFLSRSAFTQRSRAWLTGKKSIGACKGTPPRKRRRTQRITELLACPCIACFGIRSSRPSYYNALGKYIQHARCSYGYKASVCVN